MDHWSFVFFLITPSHKAGRLFSECGSPPPPPLSTYLSLGGGLPCTQGSCYVVGYYLYWPIPYLMSLGHHLWLLLRVVSSVQSLSLRCMDGGELKLRYCLVNVGLQYTDVMNPCSVQDIRTSGNGSVLLLSFSIVNCIEGLIEFTWSSRIWTFYWCGQSMKVSYTYLNHIVGFRDIDSNAISSKYSMYIYSPLLVIMTSSLLSPHPVDICDPILKGVVCVQRVNISIRLSIGILVHSSRDESEANLSLTTESGSSVGTLANKLTMSKLTIWLDRMGASLIISMKWDEFQTYEGDFLINGSIISTRKRLRGWQTDPCLLPSLWILGIPYIWGSLV